MILIRNKYLTVGILIPIHNENTYKQNRNEEEAIVGELLIHKMKKLIKRLYADFLQNISPMRIYSEFANK